MHPPQLEREHVPGGDRVVVTRHRKPGSTTSWTLIRRAQGSSEDARAALGVLIRRYERSVLAIIRMSRYPGDQSPEDLKQTFFMDLLRRGDIHKLDPDRGRFSSWLNRAVRNFMLNAKAEWYRLKKGQHITAPLSFDVAHELSAERAYMRAFAEDTLRCVRDQLRAEHGDGPRFAALERCLPGPNMDFEAAAAAAQRLGMTATAFGAAKHRLLLEYKHLLRQAVADTLDLDPERDHGDCERAVEIELRVLYRYLREVPPTEVLVRREE